MLHFLISPYKQKGTMTCFHLSYTFFLTHQGGQALTSTVSYRCNTASEKWYFQLEVSNHLQWFSLCKRTKSIKTSLKQGNKLLRFSTIDLLYVFSSTAKFQLKESIKHLLASIKNDNLKSKINIKVKSFLKTWIINEKKIPLIIGYVYNICSE